MQRLQRMRVTRVPKAATNYTHRERHARIDQGKKGGTKCEERLTIIASYVEEQKR